MFYLFITALATGGIFHLWQKKGLFTYYFTVLLMAATAGKKYADMRGEKIILLNGHVNRQFSTFPIDMTLTKDPRGPRPWET